MHKFSWRHVLIAVVVVLAAVVGAWVVVRVWFFS